MSKTDKQIAKAATPDSRWRLKPNHPLFKPYCCDCGWEGEYIELLDCEGDEDELLEFGSQERWCPECGNCWQISKNEHLNAQYIAHFNPQKVLEMIEELEQAKMEAIGVRNSWTEHKKYAEKLYAELKRARARIEELEQDHKNRCPVCLAMELPEEDDGPDPEPLI